MLYGERIKIARKRAGMTQAQLAASCGLATITIQQYERDVRTPKIETLVDIANAVSVTLEYLLGMEEMDAREFGIKASDTFKNRDSEMIKDFLGIDEARFLSPEEEKERHAILEKKTNDLKKGRERINRAIFFINEIGIEKAADFIEDLAKIPEYQRFKRNE